MRKPRRTLVRELVMCCIRHARQLQTRKALLYLRFYRATQC